MCGFFKRLGMLVGGMLLFAVCVIAMLWPIWGWELARTSDASISVLVLWAIGTAVAVLIGLIAINDQELAGSFREPLATIEQAIVVWLLSPLLVVILAGLAFFGVCYGLFKVSRWLVVGQT